MTKYITCDNIESSKRKSGERCVWRKPWSIDKINTSLHCKNGVILDRDSCFYGFGYCGCCKSFGCVIQKQENNKPLKDMQRRYAGCVF
nr:MAG TPA: hypothetical protein [Caudoviricetes sp.]